MQAQILQQTGIKNNPICRTHSTKIPIKDVIIKAMRLRKSLMATLRHWTTNTMKTAVEVILVLKAVSAIFDEIKKGKLVMF